MNREKFSNLIETLQSYYKQIDTFLTHLTSIDVRLMEYTVYNTYGNNMGLMFDELLKFQFGNFEELIAWYIMEKQVLNTQFDGDFEINTIDDLIEYITSKQPDYFGE